MARHIRRPARRAEQVMGTVFSFDIRGDGVTSEDLSRTIEWLHWVDETFSTYRVDSQVSRLSRGDIALDECSPDVAEVLELCARVQARSDGYFTATSYGSLDPSAVVKGWSVDRAHDMLTAAGSRAHSINGGGDVRVLGEPEPGEPWRVGIADPRASGHLLAVVSGRNLAVATSGTGERGAHVVNPRTGRPATDLLSLTAVSDAEPLALVDAYSTAAFAMGADARSWLEDLTGVAALVVTATGDVWRTAGWDDYAET